MSDPPAVIVVVLRSSSTLWLNDIAAYPHITAFNEMYYLSPWHRNFRHALRADSDLARGPRRQRPRL